MKKHLMLAALLVLGAPVLPALAQTTAPKPPAAGAVLPSGYSAAQLNAVTPLLVGLNTLQVSRLDLVRGRVVVVGLSAVDRLALIVRLRQAGLPSGVVDYQTPEQAGVNQEIAPVAPSTVNPAPATPAPIQPAPLQPAPTPPATSLPVATTLPKKGAPLAAAHRAAISGPTTLRAGTAGIWSFTLTSTGTQPIRLSHGACDVRFEVIDAAGTIVRPDPKDTLCTMQLVITNVGQGETREVQKLRWEGRNAAGQPLPAGTYTLRAVFNGAGVYSAPATLRVTVQ